MSKRLLIVLIIFAVDVFGAFAWLFYTETPGYVLSATRKKMAETTAVHLQLDAAGEGTAAVPPFSKILQGVKSDYPTRTGAFTWHATSDVDLRDLGEVKRHDAFRLAITTSNTSPDAYDGEDVTVGSRRFVKFDGLPESGALSTSLRGSWAELDRKSFDFPFLRPGPSVDLDAANSDKLRALFRSSKLVSVTKELPETSIDGVRQFHYRTKMKPEAVTAFVVLATGLREKRSLADEELKRLATDIERIGVGEIDLWISKRDFFLSRIQVQGVYSDAKSGGQVPYSATISLSRWNESVDIAPPPSARPIRGFLELSGEVGLTLSSGKTASSTLSESSVAVDTGLDLATSTPFELNEDQDSDGLTNTLEAFYRTDPKNPDSDGDGLGDGYEVMNGYDPTGPGALFDFGTGKK